MTKENQKSIRSLRWERIKPLVFVYSFMFIFIIVAEIITPGFANFEHLENMLRQASFLGFVAIGQTLVILTAGIDLSVSFTITLADIVAADMMNGKDENTLLAVIIVILIGALIGLANGVGVHYLKISPMIMTLGIGNVVYGISFIYSKGAPKGHSSPVIDSLTNGKIGGVINGSLLIWIILSVAVILILRYTVYGRAVYSIGSNIEASRYSGIKVPWVLMSAYIISGVMAAFTGIMLLGYTGTSYFTTGEPYSISSIVAVVLGGTAITGGKGGYGGTIAGVITITVITSLLTMLSMPASGRMIIQGIIILLLLLLVYRRKKY